MRIWGYLLIILNIAAAGAFTYFATAVWQKRSEWQFALFKQELVNRGLPLDATEPPADLDEGALPFDYPYGEQQRLTQIKPDTLKKLIPTGGAVLGDPSGTVTNQTDEVKRVEKVVFGQLDAIKDPAEKRLRQLILLLNLARNDEREGAYALLRDLPVPERRDVARQSLPFMGRTPAQVSALRALSALAGVNDALAPNTPAEEFRERSRLARIALAAWALAEVPYAVPAPLPPLTPSAAAAADETGEKKEDTPVAKYMVEFNRVRDVVEQLAKALTQEPADRMAIDAARKRLAELTEGDNAVKAAPAKAIIPYIAAVGGNALENAKDVEEAKAKLLELMNARATTEAERKAAHALADLLVPPAVKEQPDLEATQKAQAAQFAANLDAAAAESLRAYFEEAAAKPTTSEKLPPLDFGGTRSALAQYDAPRDPSQPLRVLRDPGQKRRDVAHLLYHLDAHLGGDAAVRAAWYKTFVRAPAEDEAEGYKLPAADEALLKARADWHKRVAAVVGLEAYVDAVEIQATNLNRMIPFLRSRIIEAQGSFEEEYQSVVLRTLYFARLLNVREAEVKEQTAIRDDKARQLKVRLDEQKVLEDELAKVTEVAKKATDKLAVKADEVFRITKQLGEAQDALIGLEEQLRTMETGGPKSKKK
jgi:hypothetical protein